MEAMESTVRQLEKGGALSYIVYLREDMEEMRTSPARIISSRVSPVRATSVHDEPPRPSPLGGPTPPKDLEKCL
ncbi:hypothetical protein HAX54_021447 [Datura stramonium]|uniref:Uncharacterized protein n=1 Tax=Datura stramonium TaxID=4076 RepID=A0ABS8S451_DATST|nr:hypothetical protein [Datura stramonium]